MHLEYYLGNRVTDTVLEWDTTSQITRRPPTSNEMTTGVVEVVPESDDEGLVHASEGVITDSEDGSLIIVKMEKGAPERVLQTVATPSAWDHHLMAFICPIPSCGQTHSTLEELNKHLRSQEHRSDAANFFCPKCDSRFFVVSALIQHLESGSCGLSAFGEVKEIYTGLHDMFKCLLDFWPYPPSDIIEPRKRYIELNHNEQTIPVDLPNIPTQASENSHPEPDVPSLAYGYDELPQASGSASRQLPPYLIATFHDIASFLPKVVVSGAMSAYRPPAFWPISPLYPPPSVNGGMQRRAQSSSTGQDTAHVCHKCQRGFTTEVDLMQHLRSPFHEPREIPSIDRGNKRLYKVVSSVGHNLELQDLKAVTRTAFKYDEDRLVTNPTVSGEKSIKDALGNLATASTKIPGKEKYK
ncbi:hypothetical protein FRC17_008267, partial [Serendipita sp. 399]